ncbi:hypothetical protein KC19_VG124300 [Ceratodon purpureus]|uniref:Uncharacterized protein n=1 Tax=Ceratodon purpureus TaxID=3225 RepID=A0A8T0HPR8_CERPU|nr:hypothetical protein KC19_VG124300 [Ceratodon purpureus]
MPVGAVVSAEVSASIRSVATEHSPHPSVDTHSHFGGADLGHQQYNMDPEPSAAISISACNNVDGVSTRRMTIMEEAGPIVRAPRERFDVGLLPRICSGPLAANCLCYVLHPDKGTTIVAEGRTEGSWKSPSLKFGSLCKEGEQMVQIHKLIIPTCL